MRINFTREQILEYAARYVYDADDVLGARMEAAAQRGYMTRDDLIAVAKWKWRGGRTRQLCGQNTEAEVKRSQVFHSLLVLNASASERCWHSVGCSGQWPA